MKRLAVALVLGLSACATPVSGPVGSPQGALDLGGDWRHALVSSVFHRFQDNVASRYQPGLTLAAASSDLTHQGFRCAANTDMRGDPPDQICRKTLTIEACTHTWQVHLYDQTPARVGGTLTRARAIYDRRCGGEGLLGGPT